MEFAFPCLKRLAENVKYVIEYIVAETRDTMSLSSVKKNLYQEQVKGATHGLSICPESFTIINFLKGKISGYYLPWMYFKIFSVLCLLKQVWWMRVYLRETLYGIHCVEILKEAPLHPVKPRQSIGIVRQLQGKKTP